MQGYNSNNNSNKKTPGNTKGGDNERQFLDKKEQTKKPQDQSAFIKSPSKESKFVEDLKKSDLNKEKTNNPKGRFQELQREFDERFRLDERQKQAVEYKGSKIKSKIHLQQDRISFKLNICKNKRFRVFQNRDRQLEQKQKKQQTPGNTQDIDIRKLLQSERPWEEIDQINKLDPLGQTTNMVYREILNTQVSLQQRKQDMQTRKFVETEIKKDSDSQMKVILAVQAFLKGISKEIDVTLSNKSDLQSQVSIKVISTGFTLNKFICSQKIQYGQYKDCKWTFQQLAQSPQQLQKFEDWYKSHLLKEFKIQGKQIKISSISKGSINVQWQIADPTLVAANPQAANKIVLHPYFNHFKLSTEDFDPRGNIKFFQNKNYVEFRGNWPYYQPQKCKRYGLKVCGKFDEGNDTWLKMNNVEGQWPVAYHGVNYPSNLIPNQNKTVIQNILQGMKNQKPLIPGSGQAYSSSKSVNKDEIIKNGIYCTPHFYDSLQYTHPVEVNQKKYNLVFQCRVNPKKVHIAPRQQYWIVNQPSEIRPYGIILIEDSIKKNYPRPEDQFKQKFSYRKYKDRIDKTSK